MPDKSKQPAKKKVLDLLDEDGEKKRLSRRERQRVKADEQGPTVEQAKKQALDLFSEDAQQSGVTKTNKTKSDVLPSISKVKDEQDPDFVKVAEKKAEQKAELSSEEAGEASASDDKVISIKPPIIVSDLADLMDLKPFHLMKDLIELEVFVAPTQAIEPDIAEKICEKHGFTFEREKREKGGGVHKTEEKIIEPKAKPVEAEPVEKLELRAPIITFMGHVDHGKTSLLDYIRESRVTSGEAGGITQHIGSYRVETSNGPITFIDTPGHAIFSHMRARGADVTDIVVLVVAADDGVMPQTKEAIEHAKKAEKTIIVAINKIDTPGADVMRVKGQLMEHDVQTTDFGGDVEFVEVSAIKGDGMDELTELMALQAEVLELKANPRAVARGVIIESEIQPGKGPTATVVVMAGTLKQGDSFICGPYAGKVKGMIDDHGNRVKEAGPATPVEVLGFSETPHVGDELVVMKNDRQAKKLADERQSERRRERLDKPSGTRLEDLLSHVHEGDSKTKLKIILKTDVQGSVQAIKGAVEDIKSDKVEAEFLSASAGAISENDITMAASSGAVVLGFNTKVDAKAVKVAKSESIQIKLYTVVYELLAQVEEAMLGLLEPELREKVMGHAEVKQVFKLKRGRAAGSMVTDGKVHRKAHARVLRDGIPVFDGKMSTLRRFEDEVEEVKRGLECGIRLGQFNEYEEGDIIECYELEQIEQTL